MFNSEALRQKIKENKALLDKKSGGNNFQEQFFKLAWLPEGIHKVRLIPDINNELSVETYVHKFEGSGKLFPCARQSKSDPVDNCPACKALADAKEKGINFDYKWGRSVKSKCLIYLVSTSAKQDENWKAGSYYLLCSNSFLHKGVTEGLMILVDNIASGANEAEIMKILDVTADNQPAFVIQHKPGKDGSTTCMPDAYTRVSALQIPEGAIPNLKEIYLNQIEPDTEMLNKQVESINNRVNGVASGAITQPVQQVVPTQPQVVVTQPQIVQQTIPQPVVPQPVVPQPQVMAGNTIPQPPPPVGNFNVTEPNQVQ